MWMPIGRSEKRTPVELAVVLSCAHKKPFKERAVTENVSSHGLRVITKSMWQPGARVLVSFVGEDIDEQARVVYCQKESLLWGSNSQRRCRARLLNFPGCRFSSFFVLQSATPA
jgi:hypothetical protein